MKSGYPLEKILDEYSDEQLRVIFRNSTAWELNAFCTIGCDFCGFEAKKGSKTDVADSAMSSSQFDYILDRFGNELKESHITLNYATDPGDWEDGTLNYRDILTRFEQKIGYKPFTSTAVPKGKEELILELLLLGKIDRVSISHMNHSRLAKFFNEKYPLLATHEFEIEDNHSQKTVRFTHKKKSLQNNWIELVLKLTNNFEDGRTYVFTENGTRDPDAFWNVGEKNVGNLSPNGIGCTHGTLLRRTGLYNISVTVPSKEHPQGVIYQKIDPNNFFVWHYWYNPYSFPGLIRGPKGMDNHITPKFELIKPINAVGLKGNRNAYDAVQQLIQIYSVGIHVMEQSNYDSDLLKIKKGKYNPLLIIDATIDLHEKNCRNIVLEANDPYRLRLENVRSEYKLGKTKLKQEKVQKVML